MMHAENGPAIDVMPSNMFGRKDIAVLRDRAGWQMEEEATIVRS
jgi:hypothetical protein